MADVKTESKKEFLGQPVWVWAVAGAVMVAAAVYLYRRNAKNQAAASQTAPGGTGADSGVSSLYGWMLDQQSSPTPTTSAKPGVCPPGMHPDSSGKCVCGPGYYWNSRTGKCTKFSRRAAA